MRAGTFLFESLQIAVNRTATQISSILIVALLGLYATSLLAAFSLALAAVAIFLLQSRPPSSASRLSSASSSQREALRTCTVFFLQPCGSF